MHISSVRYCFPCGCNPLVLQKPFWFLQSSNFEQTTVILGFITTLTVGFSKYLKSQNHGLLTNPSQSSPSQLPSLWIPTNHSKAIIEYEAVYNKDQKSQLDEILQKHYGAYVGKFYKIDLVDEESGTLNYRVKGLRRKPTLLRIHKRITSEIALNTIQTIQRHLFESGIFSESPVRNRLMPLPANSGRMYEQFNGRFIEIYPFADDVSHYSGENLRQIESVANEYGSVQKMLQNLDPSVDLNQLTGIEPYISWFKGDVSLFDLICEISNRASKGANPDKMTIMFNDHQSFLKEIWQEIKPQVSNFSSDSKPVLQGFHPHNTFFQNDKCVLIYDYESVSKNSSESEALAFTIHRFIREYIRLLKLRGYPVAESEIPKIIEVFLMSYEAGRGFVPSNFISNLGLYLKISNLARLVQNMEWNYKITKDPSDRSENAWYSELIKFISYLKEAKYFAPQQSCN